MLEYMFLLLPVAAFSGWYVGARRVLPRFSKSGNILSSDYYTGLNYLLNEQPDKAVDAFIRMLDVSPDTVETTLALGNLFRRRGEVDRAIRIHQNLIAKPNLTADQRAQSLFELGQDYMRAGVYDRAETLFLELSNSTGMNLELSLRNLITIYERERDWAKAIRIAKHLQGVTRLSLHREIAQYLCELAEDAWEKGNMRVAFKYIKQSLAYDKCCVRASVAQGNMEASVGRYQVALRAYKRVEYQDVAFISEVINPISHCYERLGQSHRLMDYLQHLLHQCTSMSIVLANAEQLKLRVGKYEGAQFLAETMRLHPSIRGLGYLVDFHLSHAEGEVKSDLLLLKALIEKLLAKKPIYQCQRCGFSAKSLHWQCPSCRHWTVVKPIQGIEGE